MDAITLRREDHKLLRTLSQQLADTTENETSRRGGPLKRLETERKAHATIEEEIFDLAILDASDGIELHARSPRASGSSALATGR